MTPDLLVRLLTFWQSELIVLSAAIGKDMNAALGANISLSDPEVAWRLVVRDHVDHAIGAIGLALLTAREPQVAGQLCAAEKEALAPILADADPSDPVQNDPA